MEGDQADAFDGVEADAGDVDEDPEHPGFENSAGEEDNGEHAGYGDEGVDVGVGSGLFEYLRQQKMYLRDQGADEEDRSGDQRREPQADRVAQRADRALAMLGLVFPREPAVNAHSAKIHLQEHIGVELYLVEDDEEKYRVRDAGGPCENVRPRRKENRNEPEHGADKFDVADRMPEYGEENLFDIKERIQGKIEHDRV